MTPDEQAMEIWREALTAFWRAPVDTDDDQAAAAVIRKAIDEAVAEVTRPPAEPSEADVERVIEAMARCAEAGNFSDKALARAAIAAMETPDGH